MLTEVAMANEVKWTEEQKQEIYEKEYNMLTEDKKRLYQRNLTRKGNYSLNIAAKNAGVKNFDKFYNAGYACDTHNKIGKIVRKAIKEANGTMPEDLPTSKKSLKQLEKEKSKQLKAKKSE